MSEEYTKDEEEAEIEAARDEQREMSEEEFRRDYQARLNTANPDISKEEVKRYYGTTRPQDRYLSLEEKLAVAELSKKELIEKTKSWIKDNLLQVASQLNRSVNYFITYRIDEDGFTDGVMASDNWVDQEYTANGYIGVVNKSQNEVWDVETRVSVSNIDYIINELSEDNEYREEFDEFEEYANLLEEANVYLEGTREKFEELMKMDDLPHMIWDREIEADWVVKKLETNVLDEEIESLIGVTED